MVAGVADGAFPPSHSRFFPLALCFLKRSWLPAACSYLPRSTTGRALLDSCSTASVTTRTATSHPRHHETTRQLETTWCLLTRQRFVQAARAIVQGMYFQKAVQAIRSCSSNSVGCCKLAVVSFSKLFPTRQKTNKQKKEARVVVQQVSCYLGCPNPCNIPLAQVPAVLCLPDLAPCLCALKPAGQSPGLLFAIP